MNAEIIAIGSELLLGQIIDTNSSYIATCLAENGIELIRTTAVGDDLYRMKEVINEAINRSQIVITTGGLGPTEDDLTREAIAQVTQHSLVFQPQLMEKIEIFFKRRGFQMTENNRKQAYIPEGAIPIENPKGTAPGFIVEGSDWVTISIPGVPSEMEYLMKITVIPYIRKRFSLKKENIQYKVLRVCGLGESAIGLQIKDIMRESKNPTVGTLASAGDIKIRITAKAGDQEEASNLIKKMGEKIRDRLGILIYGVDNETLQGNIVKVLEKFGLNLSVVETFTSGIISQKLATTNSPSFEEGVLLPYCSSQMRFLNIPEEKFSALCKEPNNLAYLLALKARNEFKTNIGLAIFGKIADERKDEECYIKFSSSLITPHGEQNQEHTLDGEFWMVRERASIIALDMLRKYLLNMRHRA